MTVQPLCSGHCFPRDGSEEIMDLKEVVAANHLASVALSCPRDPQPP